MSSWDSLSMKERADVMKLFVEKGIYNLDTIRREYNLFAEGGGIHIKPSHRGRLTELKERTGKSEAELYNDGNPAHKKMVVFARNARKWKHEDGGNLFYPGGQIKYGRPYYSYDENGRKIDDTLNYNATLPEIVITPDSKKSPAEMAVLERERRAAHERVNGKGTYDAARDREWTGLQVLAAQKEWENSAEKKALDYAQAAATGVGIGADIVSGLPIYSSLKGASTLSRAETPMDYVEGGLWLSPIGSIVGKEAYSVGKQAVQTAIDNGTLWDAYTTFGGRFGNYGNNIFTNMYGTAARRFGLPDKARLPADAIRKLEGKANIENGVVDFTGEKAFLGNPHTNMTLDQPVVSHPKWVGDGADTYLFPTKNVVDNTGDALKSIEPSDMFVNGVKVTETPQNVTLISGDTEALNWAKGNGLQTLSSPKLRRMYKEAVAKYEKDLAAYNKLSLFEKANQKPPVHPKEVSRRQFYWPEYANEVARLQARRGTPTLADFKLLEEQTGLNAGVAPSSQYDNVIRQVKGLLDGTNRSFIAPVYPNGREVDLGLDGLMHEFDYLNRANYNKVFYDPASMVESEWQIANRVK